jgi:hypothetical protein
MSAQKTLSQIAVAAVALFIVSLPAFAQTDNVVAKTDKDTDTTAIVAVNIERLAPTFEVKNEDNQKPAPKFSAAKFMQAVQETSTPANVVTIYSSSAFQLVPAPATKSNTVKGITFVPSRGPKFPWQVF